MGTATFFFLQTSFSLQTLSKKDCLAKRQKHRQQQQLPFNLYKLANDTELLALKKEIVFSLHLYTHLHTYTTTFLPRKKKHDSRSNKNDEQQITDTAKTVTLKSEKWKSKIWKKRKTDDKSCSRTSENTDEQSITHVQRNGNKIFKSSTLQCSLKGFKRV